jgi:hypothetical protein
MGTYPRIAKMAGIVMMPALFFWVEGGLGAW